MIRGLYTAASGMLAQQAVQDAIASNLANINTTGFKQDVPTFRAIHDMAVRRYDGETDPSGTPVGDINLCVDFDRNVTDMSAGALQATGNTYDLALQGNGFFSVQTPQGERYTRAGAFHLEPVGKGANLSCILADDNGNAVLGAKGPINLAGAKAVVVDNKGTVFADGKAVDQLKLVTAPVTSLVKQGNNLFTFSTAAQPATAMVRQGYLEGSNVSAVGSMVKMITVQRAYDAAQKAITAQDDSLAKIINDGARV